MVMNLPTDLDGYRILFEGEYNKTSNRYSRNYVTIDNLELRSCVIEGKNSPLEKRKGNWSRNVSRSFWDRYLVRAGQLLANFISLSSVVVPEVYANVNSTQFPYRSLLNATV